MILPVLTRPEFTASVETDAASLVIGELTADNASNQEWDAFIANDARASFCHLSGWRTIMRSVLGHESRFLAARWPDGTFAGALPLVHVRTRLLGDYLMSMPFLNYGGAIGDPAVRAGLEQRSLELAAELKVDLLEIRDRYEAPTQLSTVARKVTTVLDLPATSDELWNKGLRSKLRSQIRRPMKEGLRVQIGADQLAPFYRVFARNMRDLGTPVLPARWFGAIRDTFGEKVVFAAVYAGDVPVAGACGFMWGDEFEITWASSLREYAALSPNMLLYWSLMENVIARGAKRFNFGRSTPGSSTHRFKQQWGGTDQLLPWGSWGRKAAPPTADSAKFKVAQTVWSKLPIAVATWAGPTLARQLP